MLREGEETRHMRNLRRKLKSKFESFWFEHSEYNSHELLSWNLLILIKFWAIFKINVAVASGKKRNALAMIISLEELKENVLREQQDGMEELSNCDDEMKVRYLNVRMYMNFQERKLR